MRRRYEVFIAPGQKHQDSDMFYSSSGPTASRESMAPQSPTDNFATGNETTEKDHSFPFSNTSQHSAMPYSQRMHHVSTPMVSDYESDAQYFSDVSRPQKRTSEELNLAVLQRHNPEVVSIRYIVPYAVVYIFSPTSQQWEKTGVEGTAFLCILAPSAEVAQRSGVFILNRRGLENFYVELHSPRDVEVTAEYIILGSESQGTTQAYGLWIYAEPLPSSTAHHRMTMAEKIVECAELAERSKRSHTTIPNGGDEDPSEGIGDGSEPMGRQLSLKELFGQQRRQDDAWSVRSHSPHRPGPSLPPPPPPPSLPQQQQKQQPQQQPQQQQSLSHQFAVSADTDFFRSSQRRVQGVGVAPVAPTPEAAPKPPPQAASQREILLNLFK